MTTTPSIDVTAILDATKDSSDDEEGYSDSSNDDGDWVAYKILPEREPEWDVDSFDGREFKVHPKVRELYPTQELYDEYYNDRLQAFQSKGFIADPLSGIYEVDLDGPMKGYNSVREFMADLANVCVMKFNQTKGNTLELVNVERVNESGGAKWKLYTSRL